MKQVRTPVKFRDYDYVTVKTNLEKYVLSGGKDKVDVSDICLEIINKDGCECVYLTALSSSVEWIKLRWNKPLPKNVMILGDAWERSYGDLEWRGISGKRYMPWYFLASGEGRQWGFGVRVRPSAMCYWQADTRGITLMMDVRCGGEGVLLNGRRLKVAELVCMESDEKNSFRFAQAFCKKMCSDPVLPDMPVYGSNNWYYAYGVSSEKEILSDSDYVLELAKEAQNRPYMIIDDGWQEKHRLNEYNGGPWKKGNDRFPDMKGLAEKLEQKGVCPGLWLRLLQNEDKEIPDTWRLPLNGCLDPSRPEVLEYIKDDVKRVCEWGYKLIKHDFSTYDLFGRWGFEMNPKVTQNGWHFYDRSLTSAEVVKKLYQTIYETTKEYGVLIIGCNTIGHLGAGLMHINRTGDDTSGFTWERTRRMGINTLAFRLPQHRIFFEVDADCVGVTGKIPWKLNRQWADVIAESGTPLFISVKPGIMNEREKEEMRMILKKASGGQCCKIPEDWIETDCPEVWKDEERQVEYNWYEEAGAELECNDEKFHAYVLIP